MNRKLSVNQRLAKLTAAVTQLTALNEALINQMKANTIGIGVLMQLLQEKEVFTSEELQAKFDDNQDQSSPKGSDVPSNGCGDSPDTEDRD